jgi:hypothetical protein
MRPLSIFDRTYKTTFRLRRTLAWLDGVPGGISTLVILAGFVIGMWSLFSIWTLKEIVWKP